MVNINPVFIIVHIIIFHYMYCQHTSYQRWQTRHCVMNHSNGLCQYPTNVPLRDTNAQLRKPVGFCNEIWRFTIQFSKDLTEIDQM